MIELDLDDFRDDAVSLAQMVLVGDRPPDDAAVLTVAQKFRAIWGPGWVAHTDLRRGWRRWSPAEKIDDRVLGDEVVRTAVCRCGRWRRRRGSARRCCRRSRPGKRTARPARLRRCRGR